MGSMKARVHGALGPEIGRQFFGERFDPLMQRLRKVMRLGDLLTLLDYGSGPLFPAMAVPALQVAGSSSRRWSSCGSGGSTRI
jgi:hypothetical protein